MAAGGGGKIISEEVGGGEWNREKVVRLKVGPFVYVGSLLFRPRGFHYEVLEDDPLFSFGRPTPIGVFLTELVRLYLLLQAMARLSDTLGHAYRTGWCLIKRHSHLKAQDIHAKIKSLIKDMPFYWWQVEGIELQQRAEGALEEVMSLCSAADLGEIATDLHRRDNWIEIGEAIGFQNPWNIAFASPEVFFDMQCSAAYLALHNLASSTKRSRSEWTESLMELAADMAFTFMADNEACKKAVSEDIEHIMQKASYPPRLVHCLPVPLPDSSLHGVLEGVAPLRSPTRALARAKCPEVLEAGERLVAAIESLEYDLLEGLRQVNVCYKEMTRQVCKSASRHMPEDECYGLFALLVSDARQTWARLLPFPSQDMDD